ncbi:lmo0937 family membrane protein [Bhargavaea cecembensis]|uniref:lmo0937 family membrane protein n=1 Tax=Bhargavaea cecembensis TaxID=394098 RepID=UPI000AE89A66|nr:lmo0937 family membrane protein [Bhargavaea cecembensis]
MKFLWWIILALIAFWVLGLVFKVAGGLIHILLVIAGILFIISLFTGRKSV